MAALAGVAQSTVSYVMSGNRPISQKTRDKVEKAMRELGYVPDAHARAMISNRSYIIGLLTETTETTQGAELFPILRAIRIFNKGCSKGAAPMPVFSSVLFRSRPCIRPGIPRIFRFR